LSPVSVSDERPAGRWTQSWPAAACLLAAASFLTLLAAIPEIFVPDTALGWVDAWYYVGLMQALPEGMRYYASSLYQAERLAWTLPGYLFNQVGPPLAANYALKALYFAATIVFLFGALRQTCGWRTALFVSALASLYSFLAHSLGSSYIDGAANTYFLIAVYGANRAALGERFATLSAFVAGAACVAVLFTQFAYIVVVPLLAGYALLMWAQTDRRDKRPYLLLATGFLTGAAATWMAALSLYRYWEVPGWPLQVQFELINSLPTEFAQLFGQRDVLPARAYWLLLPATVVAWILPAAIRAFVAGWKAALRLPPAQWLLLSVSGVWVGMNVVTAPWMLAPSYASFLIPVTFLALGPAIAPFVERLSSRSYKGLLGLLYGCAFASYYLANSRFAAEAALAAGACLILATLLRAASRLPEDRRAPAVLALLVLALIGINFATADYTVQLRNHYRNTEMARVYRAPAPGSEWPVSRSAAFEAAVNTANILRPRLSGRSYYFWYNGDDPLGMFFRSVGSMFYAWSTRDLLDERFQEIDRHTIDQLMPQPGKPIRDLLILSRRADVRVQDSPLDLRWTEAFVAAGTRYYAHYFVMDMVRAAGFEASPRRLGLALRFPCSLESAGAAEWYDRGIQTGRNSAAHDALQELFSADQRGRIQCLTAYRTLTERLAAAEHGDPYVPSAATCAAELARAEVYLSEVFDDPLRQLTRPALEMARNAQQEQQSELCRVAVGEIRRAYFEAIFGGSDADAAAAAARQRLAAVGVDFEPSLRRIGLASRFPCRLETAAAADWWDRPGRRGVTRTSADREALEDLFRETQHSAIRCLSAYKRLTERLGAAEQRSAYLPATAACEPELAIAEVYVSKVFDDSLRQKMMPILDAARVAQQQGQLDECRLRAGAIRRAYVEAIYGPN
jgi:hypothetical protein